MKIESFNDIEAILKPSILSLSAGESYSLKRIKKLMAELGDPQEKIKIVHVAGTSGKTSTCYFIAEMLRLNGYKTGLSASPHIDEMNERLQVDLIPLNETKFCQELTKFLKILSKLSIKPTYFELFTAFAYWYFAKSKVEYAVIETGLGGLLDATNVVSSPNKICVITDIGLDHTDILGSTFEKITVQKAGIIQPNNPVFINAQNQTIIDKIKSVAEAKSADLTILKKIDQHINLPLIQKRNWSLAKSTAAYVFYRDGKNNLSAETFTKAANVFIPGRMERWLVNNKEIILDGAHNYQKIQGLIESLKQEINGQKVCVILAIGENKKQQLPQMAKLISSVASEIILTSFDEAHDIQQKSLPPSYLAQYFLNKQVKQVPKLEEALDASLNSKQSKILITGSLYLVGKVRKALSRSHKF